MARKTCKWKNGRRCNLADCPVTKADCEECDDYKEPDEESDTVLEHLGKMEDHTKAAEIICAKVEECHGWPNRVSEWLRSTWEDSDANA